MSKREEFHEIQKILAKKVNHDLLEKVSFRTLGIKAMLEWEHEYRSFQIDLVDAEREISNISRLISHTLGDDYVN